LPDTAASIAEAVNYQKEIRDEVQEFRLRRELGTVLSFGSESFGPALALVTNAYKQGCDDGYDAAHEEGGCDHGEPLEWADLD